MMMKELAQVPRTCAFYQLLGLFCSYLITF